MQWLVITQQQSSALLTLFFVLFSSVVSRDWNGDDSGINSSHMSTEGHNTLVHREPSESLSQPLRPALVLECHSMNTITLLPVTQCGRLWIMVSCLSKEWNLFLDRDWLHYVGFKKIWLTLCHDSTLYLISIRAWISVQVLCIILLIPADFMLICGKNVSARDSLSFACVLKSCQFKHSNSLWVPNWVLFFCSLLFVNN